MKRTLLSLALVAASSGAYAAPFYLNVGTNYEFGSDKVCDECTAAFDQIVFQYQSTSVITDTDGTPGISPGDTITTSAGITDTTSVQIGELANNQVGGFEPGTVGTFYADNGYSDNWMITYSISGLTGTVDIVNGTELVAYYDPGVIDFYITQDFSTYYNFMDIALSSGSPDGTSSILVGEVDFSDVDLTDIALNNLFNSTTTECNGSSGFYDIWLNCGEDDTPYIVIDSFFRYDTGDDDGPVSVSDFVQIDATSWGVSTEHNGSGTFTASPQEVPVPGTLALMGAGLLGLGGMRFKKRKK